jgi:hypothetical protein
MIRFLSSFLIFGRPSDQKIHLLMNQFKLTREQLEMCIQTDPSPNQTDFVTWIARMLAKNQVRLPEDGQGIRDNLAAFQTQRRQPGFGGNKDINAYRTPADLSTAIQQNAMTVVRSKDIEKFKGLEGTTPVVQKGDITIFKVTNPKALMILSDSTDWCTRHEENATDYLQSGPSFVAFYRGHPYAQLHPASNQFKDKSDMEFAKEYREEGHTEKVYRGWGHYRDRYVEGDVIGSTIADPVALEIINALRAVSPEVAEYYGKKNYMDPALIAKRLKGVKNMIEAAVLSGQPLTPEEEAVLGDRKPGELEAYANKFHPQGRWKPLEDSIISHLKEWDTMPKAIAYAATRIRGRWPELEPTILRNVAINDEYASHALSYAASAVKGRWPELEKKFWTTKSKDTMPKLMARYAIEALKKPWKDVITQQMFPYGMTKPEYLICRYAPEEAMKYAEAFNLKPWPQFAQILLQEHEYGHYIEYLEKVEGGRRDPELERLIVSPAKDTYKEQVPLSKWERRNWRWHHRDEKDGLGQMYAERILKRRWPEFEQRLIGHIQEKDSEVVPEGFSGVDSSIYRRSYDELPKVFDEYLEKVVKGRWPEFEQALLQRYRDFPDEWESNQALVSGYLMRAQDIVTGKPIQWEYHGHRKKPEGPVSGIWPEGEAILRQRSPGYEEKLKEELAEGYKEYNDSVAEEERRKKLPEEERKNLVVHYVSDSGLWSTGKDIKAYIEFLRSVGNDWPAGVELLNNEEDFREKNDKRGYVGLGNRLASHPLLKRKRLGQL